AWWAFPARADDLIWPSAGRGGAIAVLVLTYCVLPFGFTQVAERTDPHFVATLRAIDDRTGKRLEIDRNQIVAEEGSPVLRLWTGERLALTGEVPEPGKYSVRGTFTDPGTLRIEASHRHFDGFRSYATVAGLGFVALWWLRCLLTLRRPVR
ncbi:MAG: hypothetical protein AAFQ51_18220, partial [Pseudomonadota bacterium]